MGFLRQKPKRILLVTVIGTAFVFVNIFSERMLERLHSSFSNYFNDSRYISLTKEKMKEEILKELRQSSVGLNLNNLKRKALSRQTSDSLNKTFTNSSMDYSNVPNHFDVITLKPNLSQMINSSQNISTIYAPYILENKNICAEVKNLSALVIIHTAVDHFQRRLSIRTTWTNNTYYLTLGTIRTLFLLGRTKDKKKQKRIEEELSIYKDILQGDFIDTYRNLTLKGVMAYKWITERCRNAKIILKTDDDIIVNMFHFFVNIFPKYTYKTRQIVCDYRRPGQAQIFRNKTNKWFISDDNFRGLRGYPTTNCQGFMVIFTNDFIPALFSSAKVTPFFWVDDIYLYGLVPGNVQGVQFNRPEGKWNELHTQNALKCYRNQTAVCDFLVIGARSKETFTEIWHHIVDRQANVTV